jgi:riboflavin transporter FmnP
VFSVFALYGAFGNALVHAAHLSVASAAVIAIVPALLVEWVLIRPVWNLMFRFRADASSSLEELILAEAHAVVPFRNGQGVISTVRDGRRVQLHARLCDQDAALPVAFGQRLRIEDVDARRERVTVSVLSDGK